MRVLRQQSDQHRTSFVDPVIGQKTQVWNNTQRRLTLQLITLSRILSCNRKNMYPALRHLHCVMGETKIQNQNKKSNYRISKCNIFQSTWREEI